MCWTVYTTWLLYSDFNALPCGWSRIGGLLQFQDMSIITVLPCNNPVQLKELKAEVRKKNIYSSSLRQIITHHLFIASFFILSILFYDWYDFQNPHHNSVLLLCPLFRCISVNLEKTYHIPNRDFLMKWMNAHRSVSGDMMIELKKIQSNHTYPPHNVTVLNDLHYIQFSWFVCLWWAVQLPEPCFYERHRHFFIFTFFKNVIYYFCSRCQ